MNRQIMRHPFTLLFFYIALVTGCMLPGGYEASAQETTGGIHGRVTDDKQQPLAGVTIKAAHTPSGTHYNTVTSADGRFSLGGLRVGGPYLVTVSYVGMTSQQQENIQVALGQDLALNFTLAPDSRQLGEVVVKGTRPGRNVINGAGQQIGKEQLRAMPTLSRSIQDITRLVPQGSKDNTFLGSNFRYNNVTIDGAINNDAIGFSPSLGGVTGSSGMPGSSTRSNPISMDAIQEMQVYLAPYDVKIGNFTGGSINAVTRSGTNEVEGSVYLYGRNAAITGSNRAGDGRKMPSSFSDYQAGARLGMPIIRNKLFFFTNEEITRRTDPILLEAGTVEEAGVLSEADARNIREALINRYQFDPGTYGRFDVYSNSDKFFNRLDWNINDDHHLAVRNNTIFSTATNLERDQQNFRYGGIAYKQTNNQTSTVAELNSRLGNRLSNTLIAGYTFIHDYRDPLSDPAFPQAQIVGRTPGSTIFLGTDREASIFDMRQHTFEFTDNLRWNLGKHRLLLGTHNELYRITYGFVNGWNGRVDYPSIEAFLNNNPNRVRGSYNYFNNDRNYILSHPGAVFSIHFYSAYIQDEIQVNDRLRITPGIRVDYSGVPGRPAVSDKIKNAYTDPDFGKTYTYTPLNSITNSYLDRAQLSPRLGFSYDLMKDKRLVLKGGAGLFTGRIPFAWLGYSFYNNGDTYGSYDQRTDNGSSQFAEGTDPLRRGKQGIAGFAAQNGQVVNNPNAGKTQVDVIDNSFVMPQVFRGSLGLDYKAPNGFQYGIEAIYTQVVKDVLFQQVNVKDRPAYYVYDTALSLRRQPIFPSGGVNPQFANAYEMSNTSMGYRYSITGRISKKFPSGIDASLAYTYGGAKDIANGVRNSMESNWQLNQALNPNSPGLAWSNFDVRHRIIASVVYRVAWHKTWATTISLFGSMQSGSPISYGFVNYTIQNTPQQVSLAYIPNKGEAINFFIDTRDASGQIIQSAAAQAQAFNDFIDQDSYLHSRRGQFTGRNEARTPWNNNVDLHFAHDFGIVMRKGEKATHVVTVSWDIINLTNLINKQWGWVYFSPNTYNSTASVGLVPYIPSRSSQGYPLFTFQNPGKPYAVDYAQSRWQMQMGVRYSF